MNRPLFSPPPDPALPSLAIVCSAAAMKSVFDTRVNPKVCTEADQLGIEAVYYKPGREVVVLYSVHGAESRQQTATLALGRFRAATENRPVPRIGVGVTVLSDLGGVIEVFPFDSDLPSLGCAVTPADLLPVLAIHGLVPTGSAMHDLNLTVDVLRYRPTRRCTLRYTVCDESSSWSQHLVGKVYRSMKRARASWENHLSLHRQAAGSGLHVPTPIALVDEWNLVLMESVPGTPMPELLIHGSAQYADTLVKMAADALRSLHGLGEAGVRRVSLAARLNVLTEEVAALETVSPTFAHRARQLLEQLSVVLSQSRPGPVGLVHGDFTPSQLIVGFGGLTVVDLDRMGIGDPAFDVGTFLAELIQDSVLWNTPHLRDRAESFLDHYLDGRDGDGAELRQRVQLVQSLELLRIAIKLHRDHRSDAGPTDLTLSAAKLLEEVRTCLPAPF